MCIRWLQSLYTTCAKLEGLIGSELCYWSCFGVVLLNQLLSPSQWVVLNQLLFNHFATTTCD